VVEFKRQPRRGAGDFDPEAWNSDDVCAGPRV